MYTLLPDVCGVRRVVCPLSVAPTGPGTRAVQRRRQRRPAAGARSTTAVAWATAPSSTAALMSLTLRRSSTPSSGEPFGGALRRSWRASVCRGSHCSPAPAAVHRDRQWAAMTATSACCKLLTACNRFGCLARTWGCQAHTGRQHAGGPCLTASYASDSTPTRCWLCAAGVCVFVSAAGLARSPTRVCTGLSLAAAASLAATHSSSSGSSGRPAGRSSSGRSCWGCSRCAIACSGVGAPPFR